MSKANENLYNDNRIVQSIIHIAPSKTDPNGSYTGKPLKKFETPQQDADDL
ncbi:MAG: hypothetical protein RSE24_02615 [Oscillospiraceae bacterium]